MPSWVGEEQKTIQAPWWAKDEKCVIRRFGYGGRQRLMQAAVRVGLPSENGKNEMTDLQLDAMNVETILVGVISWTDEEGNDVPVTREAVETLEDEDGKYILREINLLNPRRRRTPEAQATFRGGGGAGDSEPEPDAE